MSTGQNVPSGADRPSGCPDATSGSPGPVPPGRTATPAPWIHPPCYPEGPGSACCTAAQRLRVLVVAVGSATTDPGPAAPGSRLPGGPRSRHRKDNDVPEVSRPRTLLGLAQPARRHGAGRLGRRDRAVAGLAGRGRPDQRRRLHPGERRQRQVRRRDRRLDRQQRAADPDRRATRTATNQQWKVTRASSQFNLVNGNSTRCIDVPSSSTTSGTQLQQYGCGDGTKTNQLWTFTASTAAAGKYLVKSAATGLCISNKDGSTAGNNPIVEETCSDISRMQWSFNYVSGSDRRADHRADHQPAEHHQADGREGRHRQLHHRAGRDRRGAGQQHHPPGRSPSRPAPTGRSSPSRRTSRTSRCRASARRPSQTVIVNNHSSAGGYGTSGSATVSVSGKDFIATNLTISNDYGEGSQAVAVNVNARPGGLQQRPVPRRPGHPAGQHRPRSTIVNSLRRGHRRLHLRRRHRGVQRLHRSTRSAPPAARSPRPTPTPRKTYGFLFYKCTITGAANNTTQLGRPWGPAAQVLYRESSLSATIATAAAVDRHVRQLLAERPVLRIQEHRLRRDHEQQPPADERLARPPTTPRRSTWPAPTAGTRCDRTTKPTHRRDAVLAALAVAVPGALVGLITWPSEAATTPVGGRHLHPGERRQRQVRRRHRRVRRQRRPAGPDRLQRQRRQPAVEGRPGLRSGYTLANGNSGRCIDVPSSSTTSGTQLQQYGCGDGTKTNQLWTFTASTAATGKYLVKNVATGLCLSNKDGSTAGNNPIVEETCSDIARMQWSFNYVSGPHRLAPPPRPTSGGRTWSNTADGFAQAAAPPAARAAPRSPSRPTPTCSSTPPPSTALHDQGQRHDHATRPRATRSR